MTTVLETCQVQPPPRTAETELSIPLTFFDIPWLVFHPIRRILFYDYPYSKSEFQDSLILKLKESLSLTLKHYLPVSGNLLFPLNPAKKPLLRYVPGDSVSLTIAESTSDFDDLVGNHARNADQFYEFVPQMPPVKDEPDHKIIPVMALKVTLFLGRGICIGLANHHSLGDANSIFGFLQTWASISKLGGDESKKLIFDRSVIKDPLGIDTIFWKEISKIPLKASTFPLPTNRVRATYILEQNDIQKLKNLVLAKKPGLIQVSSFVITASYIWNCLAKSDEEEVDEDELEIFAFAVDIRARMNSPVPENYFGNCLGLGKAVMEHKELVGEEGFLKGVECIAEEIKNRVNKKDELVKGAENWMRDMKELFGGRVLSVSGSPKFDLYSLDFGLGGARKVEALSIDGEKYTMSLCKARGLVGGLEVGLSLPKDRMEAFAAIFAPKL